MHIFSNSFSSDCGFYDKSGNACCTANSQNNCLDNSAATNTECSTDSFGGVPSLSGSGASNVCQGNEQIGNQNQSCLVSLVNGGCICFPTRGNDCPDPSGNAFRVCRSEDLALDTGIDACDECRECMEAACALEGAEDGNFNTASDVEATLSAWDGYVCRGDPCAEECAYDPNSMPSQEPSWQPSTMPT